MNRTWTTAQKTAIGAAGCNLMVAAAAGSGKTSTLTERIVTLLANGSVRASRLAVVTFTKAAAAELSERLYASLSARAATHPHERLLARQLTDLRNAQISTIHSFCYALIRKYRKELSLDGPLRVADPQEGELLCQRAAELACRSFFTEEAGEEAEERETLFSLLGSARKKDGVEKALIALHRRLSSLPGKSALPMETVAFLQKETGLVSEGKLPFGQSRLGRTLADAFRERVAFAQNALENLIASLPACPALEAAYAPVFAEVKDKLEAAKTAEDPETWQGFLQAAFPPRLPTLRKLSEEEAEIKSDYQNYYRDAIKKPLEDFCRQNLSFSDAEIARECEESLRLGALFLSLYDRFDLIHTRLKREKGVVDYVDLEQMTLSLLVERKNGAWEKTALCADAARDFDAVFVDEYQDTNAVQDLIFRSVTGKDNLFLVGDPKQSIYRFRGAEPSIFTRYQLTSPVYPHAGGGMQKVVLSENFRCTPKIIDFVNLVFSVMMDSTAPDSLYTDADALRFPASCDRPAADPVPELTLLRRPARREEEEEEEQEQAWAGEARFVARRIRTLVEKGEPGLAPTPSEIAVLCRTKNQCERIRAALKDAGIPCRQSAEEAPQENPEYLLVSSLLCVLDNPARDIDLAAVLSSPLFCFDADDLARVRAVRQKTPFFLALGLAAESDRADIAPKCREAREVLRAERRKAKTLSLTALVDHVYRRFLIAEFFASPDGRGSVRARLMAAAKNADRAGLTLSQFCRLLKERSPEPEDAGEGEGVAVMTMHASKGLEFPVVLVPFLAGDIFHADDYPPLLYSDAFGVVMPLPRKAQNARLDPVWRKMTVWKDKKETLREEMRLLYVAMTRARQKLILCGTPRSESSLNRSLLLFSTEPLSQSLKNALLLTAPNLLSMLLLSLRDREGVAEALRAGARLKGEGFLLDFVPPPPPETIRPTAEKAAVAPPPFPFAAFRDQLSFTYRKTGLESLPKKLSVSEIVRHGREDEAPEYFPLSLLDFADGRLVPNSARIGTATHRVMQFLDLARGAEDLDAEWERLVRDGYLTEEEASMAEKSAVAAFFASPLYQKIAASPSVVHEKRFNVFLPSEELLGVPGRVLVQGVVDLWFENPDGTLTLVDFKTDRVSAKTGETVLIERHGEQLRLYARAIEAITKKRVTHRALYSFHLKKEIEV